MHSVCCSDISSTFESTDSGISLLDSGSEMCSPADEFSGAEVLTFEAECESRFDDPATLVDVQLVVPHTAAQSVYEMHLSLPWETGESAVGQARASLQDVPRDPEQLPAPRTGGHARSYRRQTSELIKSLDRLLDFRMPSKSKSNRRGEPKPRARNVVLRQAVELIWRIQCDEQVCHPALKFINAKSIRI
jgi:hypothetical protein